MRWLMRIAGALVLGALVLIGALFVIPADRIARIAADQIRAQTGRAVEIGGEVRFSLWPVLGVKTGPVRVANADWAGPEPMFAAESLSVGVSAPELLTGTIRVTEIAATRADIRLARDRNGRGNWELATSAAAPSAGGAAPATSQPVTLEKLALSGARVEWRDGKAAPVVVEGLDLTLDWPEAAGAAEVVLALAPAGDRIEGLARIGSFADFLAGSVAPVTALVTAPGGTLGFDGRASTAGEAAGQVTLKAADTARMLAAAGLGAVEIPEGAGREAGIAAQATYTADGRLSLRALVMEMDRNRLTGAADIVLGGKPKVTAQLAAGALDFSRLSSGSGTGGGDAAAEGWSKTPIDASALGLIDGSVSLAADSLKTSLTTFTPARVTLTIDRSRAVFDLVRVGAFDGALTGQFVANNRSGLSVGGKLQASGIEMAQALAALGGVERFSGKAEAEVEFLGVGQSEAAIMNSLSGKGSVSMGRGVIAGVDLNALMTLGQGRGGTTVFDSLTASYAMEAGNLVNKDLALSLTNYRAEGAGRIGLGARDIDYVFTPVALRARGGEGLAIPILIRGPWADPSIRPDLDAVLKAKADVKLEALETEAKEKAKEKLSEKLGVAVETKAEAEEAVKDRLEDEAKKGLLKLLNRD